jgi:hypothetical protein
MLKQSVLPNVCTKKVTMFVPGHSDLSCLPPCTHADAAALKTFSFPLPARHRRKLPFIRFFKAFLPTHFSTPVAPISGTNQLVSGDRPTFIHQLKYRISYLGIEERELDDEDSERGQAIQLFEEETSKGVAVTKLSTSTKAAGVHICTIVCKEGLF